MGYNVQALFPNDSLPPNGNSPAAIINSLNGIQQVCVNSLFGGIQAGAQETPNVFTIQLTEAPMDTVNLVTAKFPPA